MAVFAGQNPSKACRSAYKPRRAKPGNPIAITELDGNEAAAIAAFEFCEDFAGKGDERRTCGYTRKFKMADKQKAFGLYGKAMGSFAERREITGADGKLIGVNNHITVEFVKPHKLSE